MKMRRSTLIIKANVITKDNQRQLRQFGNKNKLKKKQKKRRTSVYVKWLLLPKWPVLTEILEMEDI